MLNKCLFYFHIPLNMWKFHIKFIKYANKPFISPQKRETWDFNMWMFEIYQSYPLPSYLARYHPFSTPQLNTSSKTFHFALSIFKSIFNFEPFKRQSGGRKYTEAAGEAISSNAMLVGKAIRFKLLSPLLTSHKMQIASGRREKKYFRTTTIIRDSTRSAAENK